MADDFFANTVENNEVMIVKWTFPDGQLPDLTLERAQRDYELADETEAKVEALLAAGGLTHEDEMILKILGHYCGYIRKNYLNWWQRFDLNSIYRVIPTLFEKMVSLPIDTPEQRAIYLKVLTDFAPFVNFLQDKLERQAARYIRMPKMCGDLALDHDTDHIFAMPTAPKHEYALVDESAAKLEDWLTGHGVRVR